MDSREGSASELVQIGYRFALSLTHHHYDAEDLVQQAWLKLTHRYGTVTDRPLLFTTVRNLFYDQCRRGRIVTFEAIDDHDPPSIDPPSPDASADLDVLLATLRAEEREALYLNVVEGYSAREIGELTDTPRNTVLSLIHRARGRLVAAVARDSQKEQSHERPR